MKERVRHSKRPVHGRAGLCLFLALVGSTLVGAEFFIPPISLAQQADSLAVDSLVVEGDTLRVIARDSTSAGRMILGSTKLTPNTA